jgi:[acyl-carrier-protein] S-malonyltransferase
MSATSIVGGSALAFPGQGVDRSETVAALEEHAADPLVVRLAVRLGTNQWADLDLGDTRIAQPAVFAAGIGRTRARRDRVQGAGPRPVVLGHSLGEVTALTFAGVLDEGDALDLVVRRAELCAAAQESHPGRMLSLVGCPPATAEWIRRRAVRATGGVLEVAAWNNATQVVLSGDLDAVDRAIHEAGRAEVIGVPLDISGGFHSSLMSEAADELDEFTASLSWHEPRLRVWSTSNCGFVADGRAARQMVSRGLVVPVMWSQSMAALAEAGIDEVVEAGPGITLTKLSKRAKGARVRALGSTVARPTEAEERRADALA